VRLRAHAVCKRMTRQSPERDMKRKKRSESRRLVVALPPAAVPQPAIDSAAQLARLLGASLFGLFIEDPDLFAAANLPFLRELDARMRAWRPLSPASLMEDYEAIAQALRRQLLQSAAVSGVSIEFAVFRGDPRALAASGAAPTDLLALFEPITNWASHRGSAAAGMVFVPRTARPQSGPVVVIARTSADPEVALASEIAEDANLGLELVDAAQEHSSAFWLQRGRPSGSRLALPPSLATSEGYFRQLGLPPASLVIITRATLERLEQPLGSIAAGRSEPWLVLEER